MPTLCKPSVNVPEHVITMEDTLEFAEKMHAGKPQLPLLRALLKAGYKESLSLETHFRIDGDKYKASEFSIKGLLKAIDAV